MAGAEEVIGWLIALIVGIVIGRVVLVEIETRARCREWPFTPPRSR